MILNGIGATPIMPRSLKAVRREIEDGLWSDPPMDDLPLDALLGAKTPAWPALQVRS